jgi:NitT/TauT family transport system ATP-binding protein
VIVLSAAPTHIKEDLAIDLPAERDQLATRSDPRFTELRAQIYSHIQKSKQTASSPLEELS